MTKETEKPDPNYWRYRPFAPKPGTVLCSLKDIEKDSAREFKFGRGKSGFSMFVIRKADGIHGYLNLCPHYSQALNYRGEEFLNEDKSLIRCSMHFAEFRIDDGYCISGAAEKCYLDAVPLHIKDGHIYIGKAPSSAL